MSRIFVFILLASGLFLITNQVAQAAIVASDDFETYTPVPTGLNALNGGTGWLGAWNTAGGGTYQVVSGGLNYAPLDVQGGSQSLQMSFTGGGVEEIISRQLPTQTGTLYLGFLYQNSVDAGTSGDSANDFMQVGYANASLTNPTGSVIDRNTTFQVRAGTTADTNDTNTNITSTTGQTYFLVLKLENTTGGAAYDRMTLYVNPTSFTEAENTSFTRSNTDVLNLASNAFFNIRRANQENGDTYLIDHILIGDDFISVIPEPSTWLLGSLAACSLGLLVRRKRKEKRMKTV